MKYTKFITALIGAISLTAGWAGLSSRAQAAPIAGVPLGSGWVSTTESYYVQTSSGCTAVPNSSGGGTFSVPAGHGRAEFRFQNLSKSKTEQFEGTFTVNDFPSTSSDVSVKQIHGLNAAWSIVEATHASGGGLELIELEHSSAVLCPIQLGTAYQMNTIFNPIADTYDVYINGAWVEQMSKYSDTFYNKTGAYVTLSGNGPATVTWTNIKFWTGGTKPGTFTIAASAGANGSITPSGNIQISQGTDQLFTITPKSGYVVLAVTVDGINVGSVTSYQFTDVQANHTINATFTSGTTFTITATAGTGGTISPSGAVLVPQAGSQTFNIAANAGYTISDVQVDGVSKGPITSYPFTNVQANHTINANFTSSVCITATAGGSWQNSATTTETGTFTATFDATPSASPNNGVIALSKGAQTSYAGFACIVRFNTTGKIDARNGGAYVAATSVSFLANATYHFRLVVSVAAHTYSIYVTPPGGSEQTIGVNYGFRTEQNTVTSLDHWGVFVDSTSSGGAGSLNVCNFTLQ